MNLPSAVRRGRFRTVRALTAGVALSTVAALAACSSGDDSPAASDGQQTLRAGAVGAMPSVSDPHGSLFNESDWLRFAAIYDTLIGVDGDGAPTPAFAESWDVNETADEWTFHLRQDATFSNGEPVTSADVMFSLGRIDELAAQNGARLGTVDMSASSAPDEHTVVLHTSTPDAGLLQTLAGTSFIVPEGTDSFDEPIGSGPFVITEQNDTAATLEANEDWRDGAPASEEIEIRAFADAGSMADAVMAGQIDLAIGVDPVAAETAASDDSVQVVTQPAASTTPLLMRLDQAPFDEPGVREAVKLAVDRQALVDTVYLGYGEVGADLPHPNDPSAPDLEPPARDIDAAKQALAEAGHPDGIDVTLYTAPAYPAMVPTATLVAEQLAEAGINVTVSTEPAETYWSEVYGQVAFSVGYYSDMPYPVWVRQTALSTSAFNETGWQRPEFDAKFEQAMATTDTDDRYALLGEMQTEMAKDGGIVSWGHGDGITIASSDLSGLEANGGLDRMNLTELALD